MDIKQFLLPQAEFRDIDDDPSHSYFTSPYTTLSSPRIKDYLGAILDVIAGKMSLSTRQRLERMVEPQEDVSVYQKRFYIDSPGYIFVSIEHDEDIVSLSIPIEMGGDSDDYVKLSNDPPVSINIAGVVDHLYMNDDELDDLQDKLIGSLVSFIDNDAGDVGGAFLKAGGDVSFEPTFDKINALLSDPDIALDIYLYQGQLMSALKLIEDGGVDLDQSISTKLLISCAHNPVSSLEQVLFIHDRVGVSPIDWFPEKYWPDFIVSNFGEYEVFQKKDEAIDFIDRFTRYGDPKKRRAFLSMVSQYQPENEKLAALASEADMAAKDPRETPLSGRKPIVRKL